jgi:hypothetical protein
MTPSGSLIYDSKPVSSKLVFDQRGQLIAEGTCVELQGLRWVVLGNLVYSTSSGEIVLFGWLGQSGRPPTARERAEARPPYESSRARRWKVQVDDDELTEQEAIRQAMIEQQREPADLLNAA